MTAPAYRGRFAPTPSGPLHFGSLVAAAGSLLEARTRGGEWLLRIDDLDPPRVVRGAADAILRTLDAYGMHWDGAVVRQSARSAAYHAALHRLRRQALVYPCACSRREIGDSAAAGIEGPVYPGHCRAGMPADRAARALRVLTHGAAVAFEDAVQGRIEQAIEAAIGDFVVYRADGVYAYHLATVIDDAAQGITHVVRGADLLASTPRQIHLQRVLGLPTPAYAHLPVALNEAGEKLSKQTLAWPVDASAPVPALHAALRFLGQPVSDDLRRATLRELWSWAFAHWRLASVPRVPVQRAPAL
jgi:glutamyl-Q tRNA(Asp) synthetase